MKKDKLVEIFEKYLFDLTQTQQTRDQLVFNVVAEYMFHLMQVGDIPHHVLDQLENDLKEEAIEIYRKKTYGYFNLQQYRDKRIKSA